MKKIILFVFVVFLFSGCATSNYYVSVNKVKSAKQNLDTVIIKDILSFVLIETNSFTIDVKWLITFLI